MALRGEANGEGDIYERAVRVVQQLTGPCDPLLGQVAVGRFSRGLPECAEEVVGAKARQVGQLTQGDLVPERGMDELDDPSEPEIGQPLGRCSFRRGQRRMVPEELDGDLRAERFRVQARPRQRRADAFGQPLPEGPELPRRGC